MVQVKGMARLLTQRFSSDLAGRVKYSTLWPSRSDSPSEARRAMPTSRGFSGRGARAGKTYIRLLFAYNKPAAMRLSIPHGAGACALIRWAAGPIARSLRQRRAFCDLRRE